MEYVSYNMIAGVVSVYSHDIGNQNGVENRCIQGRSSVKSRIKIQVLWCIEWRIVAPRHAQEVIYDNISNCFVFPVEYAPPYTDRGMLMMMDMLLMTITIMMLRRWGWWWRRRWWWWLWWWWWWWGWGGGWGGGRRGGGGGEWGWWK